MNQIEFRRAGHASDDPQLAEVRLIIDGTDLIDLVLQLEGVPRTIACKWGEMARYAGLPPAWVCAPSKHYLGEPTSPLYQFGDRTQILECGCREPGCDPVHCRISLSGQTIVWGQFGWGHFPEHGRPFSGQGLGPFVFQLNQFQRALDSLGPAA